MAMINVEMEREKLKELIKEALGEFFQEAQERAEEGAGIAGMPVAEALDLVAHKWSQRALDQLEEQERSRSDEGRSGILAAITVRRTEIDSG